MHVHLISFKSRLPLTILGTAGLVHIILAKVITARNDCLDVLLESVLPRYNAHRTIRCIVEELTTCEARANKPEIMLYKPQ